MLTQLTTNGTYIGIIEVEHDFSYHQPGGTRRLLFKHAMCCQQSEFPEIQLFHIECGHERSEFTRQEANYLQLLITPKLAYQIVDRRVTRRKWQVLHKPVVD